MTSAVGTTDHCSAVPDRRKLPSDRASGATLALVLSVLALAPRLRGQPVRAWLLGVGGLVLVLALARPSLLRPINRAVRAIGHAIGFVVQQVTLCVLFFLVLTPMGWVARQLGRDTMGGLFRAQVPSYWLKRPDRGPLAVDLRKPY